MVARGRREKVKATLNCRFEMPQRVSPREEYKPEIRHVTDACEDKARKHMMARS